MNISQVITLYISNIFKISWNDFEKNTAKILDSTIVANMANKLTAPTTMHAFLISISKIKKYGGELTETIYIIPNLFQSYGHTATPLSVK